MSNYNVSHEFCIYCTCGGDIIYIDNEPPYAACLKRYKCLKCGREWMRHTFWETGKPITDVED